MKKRGQAAMEFLMTYGWALLVLLLIILALAFFGVLNPQNLLPEACILGPGLACEGYKAVNDTSFPDYDQTRIEMNVRNGMGKNLDIFVIYIDKKDPSFGTNTCGGFAGVIAFPNSDDPIYGQVVPIFQEGTVRSVRSGTNIDRPSLPRPPGINCYRDPGFIVTNCCRQLNTLQCTPPSNSGGTCTICDPSYLCVPSTDPFPNPGERFSSDIIIVYRELGSLIIHQRLGKITTKVE